MLFRHSSTFLDLLVRSQRPRRFLFGWKGNTGATRTTDKNQSSVGDAIRKETRDGVVRALKPFRPGPDNSPNGMLGWCGPLRKNKGPT
jgi:hypothetical protein